MLTHLVLQFVMVAGWPEKLISYNEIIKLNALGAVAGWPEKLISYNK